MAWTYSGDPSASPRDALRFLLGDTIQASPVMQDEELDYLLAKYGDNDNRLKYEAFSRIATLFAREYKRSLGPEAEDPTERLQWYKDQATLYKNKASAAGMSIPAYSYPKVFRKGMQSNPPWPNPTGDDYV